MNADRRVPGLRPRDATDGSVSLEWLLVLPLVALTVAGILEVGAVVRDALLLQDAARVGVRAAATSTGDDEVARAVAGVLDGREHRVRVRPHARRDGDLVRVTVRLDRPLGPVTHRLRASGVGRTEPVVVAPDAPRRPTGAVP
jgi:hypothetical protein